MKITIIGTGYVGLVTGICLAEVEHNVICVDIKENIVNKLNAGIPTIFEEGLETLLKSSLNKQRITFTTNLKEAIQSSDVIYLALPTPENEDGSADLNYVLNAVQSIAPELTSYKVIINKSTVPVGTAKKVKMTILEHNPNALFDVVSNPEFLKEGYAVNDTLNPERIVIGTSSEKAKAIMQRLYQSFEKKGVKLIFMDEASAELTKYAANTFLATKITFMNEMANICELVGADIEAVKAGIGDDSRIGNKFLNAGIGYGGSCFPKDVKSLIKSSEQIQYNFQIGHAVTTVNDLQRIKFFNKIVNFFKNLKGLTFAVWGLSFKPGTDDIRKAPAIDGVNFFLKEGAHVHVFDPVALSNFKKIFDDKITYFENQYEALQNADALIIFTEWEDFKNADLQIIKSKLKQTVIFDGRNIFTLETMRNAGFHYESVGRDIIN